MDNITIAVDDFSEQQIQNIRISVREWADVTSILQGSEDGEYLKAISNSDIFIGWPKAEWIAGSNIKYLQIGSSGWDAYQNKNLEKIPGFRFCTAKGIFTIGVAEHAIAMMMALARRIPAHVHDNDRKDFKRHLPYANEIAGATACIVGLGKIGTELAKRCKGLGMNVIAVVRNPESRKYEWADEVFPATYLTKAISKSDHVFATMPGGKESENLFNRNVLAAFRSSTFFYNLSRGTTVDEDALIGFLEDHKIAGAGLDVTHNEPLSTESRLWNLGDNVLITGHSAGLSNGHTQRFVDLIIRNLRNYREDKPMKNRII